MTNSEPKRAAAARFDDSGCSTIVVGKAVSATDEILIGHNEDNHLRFITAKHWVSAADHEPGEMIAFEPSAAEIPQVEHTLGFFWSQSFHPQGLAFSDGFVNEKGVVIVSNNCRMTCECGEAVKDGGIGYGIRRLLAERARSARDAVRIAIELQTEYGYRSDGRTYTVADKDEAWQILLLRGHRYVARKVQDDEVVYLANAFSLERVDDVPEGDILMSPDLIEHAIELGRYTPAKPGDFSDFSFRKAYQPIERRSVETNKCRAQTAWEMLTGVEIDDHEAFPYAVKPARKLGVEDVKNLLSAHWKREERPGFFHQSMRDICNVSTFDSVVYEMKADPLMIRGWNAYGRPCQLPYLPFYPLAGPAEAAAFMAPEAATAEHFRAPAERFDYKPDFALYAFLNAQNLADYVGDGTLLFAKKDLEDRWSAEADEIARTAQFLKTAVSTEKARAFLHAYNECTFTQAAAAMTHAFEEMTPVRIAILADAVSLCGTGTVRVAVFGSTWLDVRRIKTESARFGVTYADSDSHLNEKREPPLKVEYADLNGDGIEDAVFTFRESAAAAYALENARIDLWFFAEAVAGRVGEDDLIEKIGGFDVAAIVK